MVIYPATIIVHKLPQNVEAENNSFVLLMIMLGQGFSGQFFLGVSHEVIEMLAGAEGI